jgi:hypothetical protein
MSTQIVTLVRWPVGPAQRAVGAGLLALGLAGVLWRVRVMRGQTGADGIRSATASSRRAVPIRAAPDLRNRRNSVGPNANALPNANTSTAWKSARSGGGK